MTHKGPAGGPRPFVQCSKDITFEIDGRVDDIDEESLSDAIGHPVEAEQGINPGTIDVVIKTGDPTIEDEQFEEIENTLINETASTHTLVGWRIGEI